MKEKRQRSIQKLIRLDDEENQFIMGKVRDSGINSFQNFARHMLIQGQVITHDYSELIEVRRAVNAIGRNVNQTVKYINMSGEISHDELEHLLMQIDDVKNLVATFIKDERRAHESEVL